MSNVTCGRRDGTAPPAQSPTRSHLVGCGLQLKRPLANPRLDIPVAQVIQPGQPTAAVPLLLHVER